MPLVQFQQTVNVDGERYSAGDVVDSSAVPAGSLASLVRLNRVKQLDESERKSHEAKQADLRKENAELRKMNGALKNEVKRAAEIIADLREQLAAKEADPEDNDESELVKHFGSDGKHLEDAGLKTIRDVVDYAETNNGLTEIKGIGEKTELAILEKLGELTASE